MLPFHPSIVHLPIVASIFVPVLGLIFALMIKKHKMAAGGWLIVVGLSAFVTAGAYLALETGEVEEEQVEKVVAERLIGEHEEAAELFAGSTVLVLVLGLVAFFVKNEFRFQLQVVVVLVASIAVYLAYRTGKLGGELVYRHGAASVYTSDSGAGGNQSHGILPTPGKNTSESAFPVDEEVDENSTGDDDEKEED
jgi:uncharacterized membrane protein